MNTLKKNRIINFIAASLLSIYMGTIMCFVVINLTVDKTKKVSILVRDKEESKKHSTDSSLKDLLEKAMKHDAYLVASLSTTLFSKNWLTICRRNKLNQVFIQIVSPPPDIC